ncbi:hypothetical protein V6N12_029830 [Hibiscus sabdariffa]|uniref:Uncharacterized protein n=1 Tax=Hibiscus sabdariffa TaxID=183260 RepID=A0ABR2CX92_9ROSI
MLHSPGNSEDPRFTKKPRRRDDTPVIPDNSFPSLHSLPSPLPPATTDDVRSDTPASNPNPISYKDKVTGSHDMDTEEDLYPLDDDDIDLLEDDV